MSEEKNQNGFSLIEVIVAAGLFGLLIIVVSQIFTISLQGQRNAIASSNLQESMRYALEVISKEVREASKNESGCGSPVFTVYNETPAAFGEELYFMNKNLSCTHYLIENDGFTKRLKVDHGGSWEYITPKKISINDLQLHIIDTPCASDCSVDVVTQPVVTILMDVSVVGQGTSAQNVKLQTSIAARYYE